MSVFLWYVNRHMYVYMYVYIYIYVNINIYIYIYIYRGVVTFQPMPQISRVMKRKTTLHNYNTNYNTPTRIGINIELRVNIDLPLGVRVHRSLEWWRGRYYYTIVMMIMFSSLWVRYLNNDIIMMIMFS
jgi:hypothetical protein